MTGPDVLPDVQDSQYALQERSGGDTWPARGPPLGDSLARWPSGVGDEDLVVAPVQHRRDGGGPALSVFCLHRDGGADELGGQRGRVAVVDGTPLAGGQAVRPPAGARIGTGCSGLRVRVEIEQGPVLVALEEAREPVHKLVVLGGVGLRTVLDVGAHENQAAGAALAVGGGDAGLGAADLAGEGCALAALGLLERFFLRREFLFEGRLPRQ